MNCGANLAPTTPYLKGKWGGGCPWFGGARGCPWWGFVGVTRCVAVFRVPGVPPPLVVRVFALFFNVSGIGFVGLLSPIEFKI